VSREYLNFVSTYMLMVSKSELMNLFPMFQKAQRYFIAERKYLFNVMRPDMDDVFPVTGSNSRRQLHNKLEIELVHPKQLENFTTRMLFILIKLFKFTSYFFLNI
jgi:hypothetical protein